MTIPEDKLMSICEECGLANTDTTKNKSRLDSGRTDYNGAIRRRLNGGCTTCWWGCHVERCEAAGGICDDTQCTAARRMLPDLDEIESEGNYERELSSMCTLPKMNECVMKRSNEYGARVNNVEVVW
eukprot:CAMPEP_0197448218 /NCGR_PEP_ID=MMETSP1175-20131217/16479_1 /TAXON_ID=1003142 /ORGANISM="Triceratium dubium, Strain CCMP147" /LENGTH=126 /DNA_ID=CAMNT_0042979879 /DNA_START=248 /DNA_END=625 /DNA_ORIENTATION=+